MPRRRLVAVQEVFEEDKMILPIMISAAVGRGGETMISAQTVEAFWNAVTHVKPLSIGLNCSLGPDLMRPFLEELRDEGGRVRFRAIRTPVCRIRCRRPASTWSPRTWARFLGEFADSGLVNIAGGCCGNTPEHIAAIAKALERQREPPRERARAARSISSPARRSRCGSPARSHSRSRSGSS